MHKILFYSKFISFLFMFRAPCAHRQEVKIVLYSLWYHHTCTCDDTVSFQNMTINPYMLLHLLLYPFLSQSTLSSCCLHVLA